MSGTKRSRNIVVIGIDGANNILKGKSNRYEEIIGSESETSSSESDNEGDSEDENNSKKQKTSPSINPEEGLSVQNDVNQPVEIIDSSSSSSSSANSSPEPQPSYNDVPNNRNYNNDQYENNSDSDDDSSIEEFQFDDVDPKDEIDFDFYSGKIDLPPLKDLKVTKKLRSKARAFLKSEGHDKYIDLFLGHGSQPEAILASAKLLGFEPRVKLETLLALPFQDFLNSSISHLQNSINKVSRLRTKLSDFHKIEHLKNALLNAKNILVLTGAGILTSLGIPDFRSSKGFYSKMRTLGLDDPQDVFSLELFKRDPTTFYSIAHMILPPEHSFTPLHAFIKLLQDKGKLLRNYTQNIDNLEGNVGILPEKLVQCHGSFATASCVSCKYKIPGETLYPNLMNKKIAYCPFCENERKNLIRKFEKIEDEGLGNFGSKFETINSFGVMKPDITFFGENLPDRYHSTIKEDVKNCDLLITIGTSLKVAPVSEIVNRVPDHIPQILINRDPINHCEFDIELLGYCDQAITWLCGTQLDWEIKHKDYNKILNSGLELEVIDEDDGRYKVTDADERIKLSLKKLEETREKETSNKDSNEDSNKDSNEDSNEESNDAENQ